MYSEGAGVLGRGRGFSRSHSKLVRSIIKGFICPRKEFEPYLSTQEATGRSSLGGGWVGVWGVPWLDLHLIRFAQGNVSGLRVVQLRAVVVWCVAEMVKVQRCLEGRTDGPQ